MGLFLFIGLFSYAQDLEIRNLINLRFEIKAVYTDGSSLAEVPYPVDRLEYGIQYVTYVHPFDTTFYLAYFKVYTTECTPTVTADLFYGQTGNDQLTTCNQCLNGDGWVALDMSFYTIVIRCDL